MVRGRRPPNSKRRKETAYSIFGYYLSNRYAALLRGALNEIVEDDLSPINFPPQFEPKKLESTLQMLFCHSRSRGRSSSGFCTPGRVVKLPGFQLFPGVSPRAVPGQTEAPAGVALDHTLGGAVELASFRSAPEH
jgi:hypothetical protein